MQNHQRFEIFPGVFISRISGFFSLGWKKATSAYELFIPFLTREASIQLVYQLCEVIQQFLYFPVKDLTAKPMIYAQSNGASIQWIFGLIFQLVSIFTSAFSAINLPIKVEYLKVLAKLLNRRAPISGRLPIFAFNHLL